MIRNGILLLALVGGMLTGCGSDKDPEMCRFYQAQSKGFADHGQTEPTQVTRGLDESCP